MSAHDTGFSRVNLSTPQDNEMPTELEIRELELEDLAAVFALGERVFTADRWPNLYRTWDEYEVVEFFAGDGDTCFVAVLGEQVVGFALGCLIEKRRSSWRYGYLVWIAVHPEVGRTGVGAKLLHAMEERFIELGARMVILDTEISNTRALSFFKSQGFGHEQKHVYLTKNLTKLPEYRRIRRRLGEPTAPESKRPPDRARGRRLRHPVPPEHSEASE